LKLFCFLCFQISGRLFSDSGPRRSTRLSGDAGANTNVSATLVVGNGTSNSSKYLGGSKLSSMAFRAMTVRKSHSWTSENIDEGNESLLSFTNSMNLYYHMRIEKCKNNDLSLIFVTINCSLPLG
jgi:hypothetical protein